VWLMGWLDQNKFGDPDPATLPAAAKGTPTPPASPMKQCLSPSCIHPHTTQPPQAPLHTHKGPTHRKNLRRDPLTRDPERHL